MKMEKTWLSYLLWLMYAFEAVGLFAVYLSGAGADKYAVLACACAGIAAAACIWFLGHRAAEALGGRFWQKERSRRMLGYLLAACLLAASVFYRIYELRFLNAVENSIYYDMAWIEKPGGVPKLAHGASYCYTVLLSAVLSFSGNKAIAGMFLQIVLQILSLFMLYAGIRLLVGEAEALLTTVFMAFLPAYAGQIYSLTPEVFYFFLFTVGVWEIGLCKKISEEGKGKKSRYVLFILTGIYIGMMGYLDAMGLALLLPAGNVCLRRFRKDAGQQDKNRKGGKNGLDGYALAFCLAGTLSAMFLLLLMDAGLTGNSLGSIWSAWQKASAAVGNIRFPIRPEENAVAGAVLCFSGMLGTAGFWFHKKQKQDVWILYLFGMTAWHMISNAEYPVFITFAWAVLAGIGITSMGMDMEEKDVRTMVPELVLEDMDRMAAEEETEEKPKVKLIENPLPLPKKHVRREMDFDRIVEMEKMKYDIPVDETDDFDV